MQKVKLSARTVQILKNFSSINPSLLFKEGNVITTISPSRTILASARVNENFEADFAIYNLSRFLSVLSLFNDPELEIHDKYVTIMDGKKKLNYMFADPSNIITPPEKTIDMPDPEISLSLPNEDLQNIMKALSVLQLPEIAFVGEENNASIQAIDSKGLVGDNCSVNLGSSDRDFKMIFKAENIKIIPDDYKVHISSKKISKFVGSDTEYYIAVETNSSMN